MFLSPLVQLKPPPTESALVSGDFRSRNLTRKRRTKMNQRRATQSKNSDERRPEEVINYDDDEKSDFKLPAICQKQVSSCGNASRFALDAIDERGESNNKQLGKCFFYYKFCASAILISNLLSLFRLEEECGSILRGLSRRRRRRKTSLKVVLLFLLIIKLFTYSTYNKAQAQLNFIQSNNDESNLNQQAPPIYNINEAQPLVYLHESGSGDGSLGGSHSRDTNSISGNNFNFKQDFSSSVSPSLITAKCWNNFQNDNDCKQINVITASNGDQQEQGQRQQSNNNDDDSIITPVVIFESSSTLEPAHAGSLSPSLLSPPYFGSPSKPEGAANNSNNVVLVRHRKPPTANDIYAAPPAGATILHPADSPRGHHQHQQQSRWPQDQQSKGAGEQPVTWPSTSEFVATPQPKKAPKTTTVGRKCRDENDADCDEPEDENSVSGTNGGSDEDADDASDQADDVEDNERSRGRGGVATPTIADVDRNNEIGSGNGFDDDNEDDDDDSDDGTLETSGASEPASEQTPKYLDVSSPASFFHNQANPTRLPPPTSSSPSIVVDVEVHPTLPASFPVATERQEQQAKGAFEQQNPTPPSSSTVMPDDTIRVNPVFPTPATNGDDSAAAATEPGGQGGQSDDGSSSRAGGEPATTTELTKDDLYTFVPMPMPDGVGGKRPLQAGAGVARTVTDSAVNQDSQSDASGLSERNKFDPMNLAAVAQPSQFSTTPRSFEAPWKSRPSSNSNELWRQQQQERQRGRQQGEPGTPPANFNGNNNQPQQQTLQTEVLPALLLYASIVIFSVTALIFIIIAFAFWRRNTARQRALMQHKQNLLSGASGGGGPNMGGNTMVTSMSHGSQLMSQMQQPGLLSTYAPAKFGGSGAGLSKVTATLVKQGSSQDNMIVEEEEEDESQQRQRQVGERVNKDQLDGGGSLMDEDNNNNGTHRRPLNRGTGSWTTEEPTTSSGSQRTADSQQAGVAGTSETGYGPNIPAQRTQYPNSLSDGRQNSSSISDSQCSPDAFSHMDPAQQSMQPQGQAYLTPNPEQQYRQPQSQHMYNGAAPQAHLQQMDGAPNMAPFANGSALQGVMKKPFISSRSVENLQQQQQQQPLNGFGVHSQHVQRQLQPYHPAPMHSNHPQQQFAPMMMMNPSHPPQISPFNKPAAFANNIQRPYSRASLMNHPQLHPKNSLNDSYLYNNSSGQFSQIVPPQVGTSPMHPFNSNHQVDFQFNSPVNPARIAANPLATLSRRHPGLGLNRNIYSEDSSSLLTASPLLARTSSSLSFAFSSGQQSITEPGVRIKPQMDASGKVFNDYTPTSSYNNSDGAPPVMARKDRSEAWYI